MEKEDGGGGGGEDLLCDFNGRNIKDKKVVEIQIKAVPPESVQGGYFSLSCSLNL